MSATNVFTTLHVMTRDCALSLSRWGLAMRQLKTRSTDAMAKVKAKVKVKWIYIAPSRETSKALRHWSHSGTCNYTNACLYLVSVTRWRLPRLRLRTSNCSILLTYLPRKGERLSRPCWLTYSGRFTHISGHPSAAGRAQVRERSPVKD